MNRRFVSAVAAGLVAAVVATIALTGAAAAAQVPSPSLAVFEGRLIDLSQDWGEAQACLVDRGAGIVECFRDRAGLLAREAELHAGEAAAPASTLASCSGPLRLFADSNYGGRELDFYDRGYWQNLAIGASTISSPRTRSVPAAPTSRRTPTVADLGIRAPRARATTSR